MTVPYDEAALRHVVERLRHSLLATERAKVIDLDSLPLLVQYGVVASHTVWCNAHGDFDASQLHLQAVGQRDFGSHDMAQFYFERHPVIEYNHDCNNWYPPENCTLDEAAQLAYLAVRTQRHELMHMAVYLAPDWQYGPELLTTALQHRTVPANLSSPEHDAEAARWLTFHFQHVAAENGGEALAYIGETAPRDSAFPLLTRQVTEAVGAMFGHSADQRRQRPDRIGQRLASGGTADSVERRLGDTHTVRMILRPTTLDLKTARCYAETDEGSTFVVIGDSLLDVTAALSRSTVGPAVLHRGPFAVHRGQMIHKERDGAPLLGRVLQQVVVSPDRPAADLARVPGYVERLIARGEAAAHAIAAALLDRDWRPAKDGSALAIAVTSEQDVEVIRSFTWFAGVTNEGDDFFALSRPPLLAAVLDLMEQRRSSREQPGRELSL